MQDGSALAWDMAGRLMGAAAIVTRRPPNKEARPSQRAIHTHAHAPPEGPSTQPQPHVPLYTDMLAGEPRAAPTLMPVAETSLDEPSVAWARLILAFLHAHDLATAAAAMTTAADRAGQVPLGQQVRKVCALCHGLPPR